MKRLHHDKLFSHIVQPEFLWKTNYGSNKADWTGLVWMHHWCYGWNDGICRDKCQKLVCLNLNHPLCVRSWVYGSFEIWKGVFEWASTHMDNLLWTETQTSKTPCTQGQVWRWKSDDMVIESTPLYTKAFQSPIWTKVQTLTLNFRTALQIEMSVNLNRLWQNSDFYLDTNKVLKEN